MSDGHYADEHRECTFSGSFNLVPIAYTPAPTIFLMIPIEELKQHFCAGVASNVCAVFSQCPRALPDVVTCTRYITPMSRPSCNNSDLLRSGMGENVHFSKSTVAMAIRRVCTPPLLSPAGYLFAGTRRLDAAVCTTLLERYTAKSCAMSCLTSTRCFLVCTSAPRVRSHYLQRLCIRFYVYRKRTDFFQPCGWGCRLALISEHTCIIVLQGYFVNTFLKIFSRAFYKNFLFIYYNVYKNKLAKKVLKTSYF